MTSKNETMNSPIHKFKVLQKVFKMKKQGMKYFFKGINKKWYSIKRGFKKAFWPLCSNFNWCFHFLMSQTGYLLPWKSVKPWNIGMKIWLLQFNFTIKSCNQNSGKNQKIGKIEHFFEFMGCFHKKKYREFSRFFNQFDCFFFWKTQ